MYSLAHLWVSFSLRLSGCDSRTATFLDLLFVFRVLDFHFHSLIPASHLHPSLGPFALPYTRHNFMIETYQVASLKYTSWQQHSSWPGKGLYPGILFFYAFPPALRPFYVATPTITTRRGPW